MDREKDRQRGLELVRKKATDRNRLFNSFRQYKAHY
jgi:hypothetical protein